MKAINYIICLVGVVLLLATESESCISNLLGLCMTVYSLNRIGILKEILSNIE